MMEAVICSIYAMVFGQIGPAVASAAVVMLGGAAALGRASWGMAITVCIGISITFGAVTIASIFLIASPC